MENGGVVSENFFVNKKRDEKLSSSSLGFRPKNGYYPFFTRSVKAPSALIRLLDS